MFWINIFFPSIHYRAKAIDADTESEFSELESNSITKNRPQKEKDKNDLAISSDNLAQESSSTLESERTKESAENDEYKPTSTDRKENSIAKTRPTNWIKETRYVLISPAILMIGVNIYLGSCILELLRGNIIYYFPMLFFLIFFIAFFAVSKPSHVGILIAIFSLILLIVGILSFTGPVSMPCKNMFLAIMVSIFLSIFECWYIAFRQLKDVPSKKYIKVTSYIVTLTPAVVISLYPIQDFNLIYIISFFIGMVFTQSLWFFWILPKASESRICPTENNKLRKQLGVLRAIFGILVLLCLIFDKVIGKQLTNQLINKSTYTGIGDLITTITPWLTFFSSLCPLVSIVKGIVFKHKSDDTIRQFCEGIKLGKTDCLLQIRITSYLIPVILLSLIYSFREIDNIKMNIAKYCMLFFVIADGLTWFIYYTWIKQTGKDMHVNDKQN